MAGHLNTRIKAGTAIVDISPEQGIELAGYPHHPRHNTGVHDPLYAACIYLDNGEEKIALVSLDLLFLSKKYVKEIRDRASALTGIPKGNIMIAAAIHSGRGLQEGLTSMRWRNG